MQRINLTDRRTDGQTDGLRGSMRGRQDSESRQGKVQSYIMTQNKDPSINQ